MDFWVDLLLFLLASLPVFLIGTLPVGGALLLWAKESRLLSGDIAARTWSVIEVVGVLLTFVVAFLWWGSLCYQILMQPHFGIRFPLIEVFLALALTCGYVQFIRSFRRFRIEASHGRYGDPCGPAG